jgi:hypothetical protein
MWAAIIAAAAVSIAASGAAPVSSTPVVVELFTSQGCSSCPPADALLSKLTKDARVIPLAYHVDYWNRLGWRDPFSSREWSQRQYEYVAAMKLNGAYTPQVVINGRRQMVGSRATEIQQAIEEESKRKVDASLSLTRRGGTVVVKLATTHPAELNVVSFEDGIVTNIRSGENKGRTQTDDAIVRQLIRAGSVRGDRELKFDVDPKLGVAAFLQDPKTKEITAARSMRAR